MQTKALGLLGARMERLSKPTHLVVVLSFLDSLFALVDKKLIALLSAFFHKKSYGGHDEPYVGQAVSFVSEQGPKGAAATKVKEEQAGMAVEEALVEDEGEREMGTVKVGLAVIELRSGFW